MEPWLLAILERLTQRNAGAIDVFFRMIETLDSQTALFLYGVLIGMGIVGQDVYILFTECHRDIEEMRTALNEERAASIVQAVPGSNLWMKAQKQQE